MVVIILNRYKLCQRRHAADVILMPVSYDAMVDLLETSDLSRHMGDSFRVAIAWVSRINQERFTLRRDNQGRCASLDIDEINVKPSFRSSKNRCRRRHEQQRQQTYAQSFSGFHISPHGHSSLEIEWLALSR